MTHESLGPKTGTYEPPSVSKFPEPPKLDMVLDLIEENNKLRELNNRFIVAISINQEDIQYIVKEFIKEYRKI